MPRPRRLWNCFAPKLFISVADRRKEAIKPQLEVSDSRQRISYCGKVICFHHIARFKTINSNQGISPYNNSLDEETAERSKIYSLIW